MAGSALEEIMRGDKEQKPVDCDGNGNEDARGSPEALYSVVSE